MHIADTLPCHGIEGPSSLLVSIKFFFFSIYHFQASYHCKNKRGAGLCPARHSFQNWGIRPSKKSFDAQCTMNQLHNPSPFSFFFLLFWLFLLWVLLITKCSDLLVNKVVRLLEKNSTLVRLTARVSPLPTFIKVNTLPIDPHYYHWSFQEPKTHLRGCMFNKSNETVETFKHSSTPYNTKNCKMPRSDLEFIYIGFHFNYIYHGW